MTPGRIFKILVVIGGVVACYFILIIVIPFLASVVSTTNIEIATASTTNYAATQGFLLSIPWILFFVPGAIAIILVIQILRGPE